jgi:hypothetical protein
MVKAKIQDGQNRMSMMNYGGRTVRIVRMVRVFRTVTKFRTFSKTQVRMVSVVRMVIMSDYYYEEMKCQKLHSGTCSRRLISWDRAVASPGTATSQVDWPSTHHNNSVTIKPARSFRCIMAQYCF